MHPAAAAATVPVNTLPACQPEVHSYMQASRFWAAGSDSEDESESSAEETSSESGSGSSSSSSDAGGAKGPSRWGTAEGAEHQWHLIECWPAGQCLF